MVCCGDVGSVAGWDLLTMDRNKNSFDTLCEALLQNFCIYAGFLKMGRLSLGIGESGGDWFFVALRPPLS